ncbi:MAG: hypothetical protein LBV75_03505 [Paludibacter sp.]|jgi:hypothetical protein|nr:hypothetical protein [Paludibacter sp.]
MQRKILKKIISIRRKFVANKSNVKITFAVYRIFARSPKPTNKLAAVLITNQACSNGGIVDRFKTMVSMYQFAKNQNIPFRILHTFPYNLSDFLLPNVYNWIPENNEISLNIKDVKLYFNSYWNFSPVENLLSFCHTHKQIHAYFQLDFTDRLNQIFETHDSWGDLFQELFRPTGELANLINFHKQQIGKAYIALHFRFMGLLGDFKDVRSHSASNTDEIKNKCIEQIQKTVAKFPENAIYVASDSPSFNSQAAKITNVYALEGEISHIATGTNEKHETYLRNFLDFFMLAESQKVYSIGTSDMYMGGNFSRYAAKIHNIDFEKIYL